MAVDVITRILNAHPDVTEALVVNDIVVVVPTAFLTGPEVREILRAELPAEATPRSYAIVARIPRGPDGAPDPAALPALYHFELPADGTERRLAELCCRILGVTEIGVLDDFIEAGGDSLTAVDLVNEVHAVFGVELSLEDVFEQGTIRALAGLIRGWPAPAPAAPPG
jgi:acyl carrier protein